MGASPRRRRKKAPAKQRPLLVRYWFEILLGIVFFVLIGAIWSLVKDLRVDQGETEVKEAAQDVYQPDEHLYEDATPSQPAKEPRTAVVTGKIRPDFIEQKGKPVISLIIDDIGADPDIADRLMEFDVPLALSVLPHLAHSKQIALDVKRRGHTLMLHVPMEPKQKSINPGPGSLTLADDEAAIARKLADGIEAVPGAEGVNNHMGSLFTEDGEKMSVVIRELKKRGLFFVDSRTSAQTKGYEAALDAGLPSAERKVFLDNDRDARKIADNIAALAQKALDNGASIGIGHPHPETVEALAQAIPKVREMGVEIVPVTAVLKAERE